MKKQENFNARHDDSVVNAGRKLRATGVSQKAVALRYGVSPSTVWRWVHDVVRGT